MIRSSVLLLAALSLGCAQAVGNAGADPPSGREVHFVVNRRPTTSPSTQPDEEMDAAEFIQYTSRPDLGFISITDNLVRGPRAVRHLIAHQRALAKTGIFAAVDRDRRHVFVRKERQAGRQIDTLVVIDPPPPDADGDDADAWTEHLIVEVDGHRKIDCTIGTNLDGSLLVYGINIFPADGSIEVIAVNGDGEQLDVPDDCQDLDEPDVITDSAFADTASEDQTPMRPAPLKTDFPARAALRQSRRILSPAKPHTPSTAGNHA